VITLQVHGEPAPQGSKSVSRHGGVYEKSRKVKPWRDAIRAAALQQGARPIAGPVEVAITFWLPRPKGHYRTGRNSDRLRPAAPVRPATRPDLDKLTRSTLDGLASGCAYGDDGQVVELWVSKWYAGDLHAPGAEIIIKEYE
jgi:crossover junction endodeoxyribonuclease RusA